VSKLRLLLSNLGLGSSRLRAGRDFQSLALLKLRLPQRFELLKKKRSTSTKEKLNEEWKPLIVITLGQRECDIINRMIILS
jgi:hypothetical protein